jgi:UDP-glucose 4-epimerase
MPNYLITGGAGFIGSHLAERLLDSGGRVHIIDDLSSGSLENLRHLDAGDRLRIVLEGVQDSPSLQELVDSSDVIFHLAATVGVANIIDSPVQTLENNIRGTDAVLQAAAVKKRKVIVTSTSEVYGKSLAAPFREEDDLLLGPTIKSRWSYAASKVVDEFLALAYWHEKRVPTVVVRPFNTIGPRQIGRYGMVLPRFLSQALSGRNLTVFGSGEQSRSFTYVTDIVEWLIRLAGNDGAVGRVFNLGNPREISIAALARMVLDVTGAEVGIDFIPYDQAYEAGFEDILRRLPGIEKVTAMTGYSPRVELEEAVRLTYEWFAQVWPRRMEASALAP